MSQGQAAGQARPPYQPQAHGGPERPAPQFLPGMGPKDVFGKRIAAFVVDSVIVGFATGLALAPKILSSPSVNSTAPSFDEIVKAMSSQVTLQVAAWAATLAYFFLFEFLWKGQTPGKRLFGIRVISVDGRKPPREAIVKRSVMRIVDQLLCGFFVGLISALVSQKRQRLGDLVAGTLVVDARAVIEDGAALPPLLPPVIAGSFKLPGEENPWGAR